MFISVNRRCLASVESLLRKAGEAPQLNRKAITMNKLIATLIIGTFSMGVFAADSGVATPAGKLAAPSISTAKQSKAAKQPKKAAKAKPSAATPAAAAAK
jgi:hypothetical protein